MTDEVVGLRIEVDSNVGEAVGSLRSQLKAAQAEVAAMSEKFGETSVEAANAAKRAAELKDKIGDAKALTDAFNPDAKFKALSASLSGVAGGFAAVQGAMGLFGTESKDLEKALLQVQSAMALSQGLQAIGESIDSFKQLGAVIQNSTTFIKLNELANKAAAGSMKLFGIAVETTSTSFKVLKGAIAATGIGLLIVGIGELVSAFQNYTSEAEKAKEAQDKLNESIKKGADVGLQAELQYIDNEERLAIARAKNKNASEKELFEIEQSYRKLRANSQLRYWKEIKDIDVEGAMKAKAEIAKINADAKVAQLNFDTEEKKRIEEKNKERLEKEKEHKEAIFNINKAYKESQKKYDEEFLEELNKQDEEEKKKQEESKKNIEEYNAAEFTRYIENKRAQFEFEQEYNKSVIDAEKALQSAKFDAAQAGLNALSELAQGNKELANIIFIADKALAIAKVVVNLQSEISAYAANPTWSLAPDGGLAIKSANIAAAKIRAGINIATIAATTIGKFMNNSGGGVSGGSAGSGGGYSFSSGGNAPISPQTNVVTTQLTNQNLNELKNNTVKAYVVESEMTDSQTRIRRIQQAAEFGD